MLQKSTNSISNSGGTANRRAIARVTGPHTPESQSTSAALTNDGTQLAALRPGSLSEANETKEAKNSNNSENQNGRGEVARAQEEGARNFSNPIDVFNNTFANRLWANNGALFGAAANGQLGSASPGSAAALASSSYSGIDGPTGGAPGAGPNGKATSAKTSSSNSRQFVDENGNITNIDPRDNLSDEQLRQNKNNERENFDLNRNSDEHYKSKGMELGHQPTGTGEKLQNLRKDMSEEDGKIYDRLANSVNVFRDDSVTFNVDIANRQGSTRATEAQRDQALAFLTDSIKNEKPEIQEKIFKNLNDWGGMDIFLSNQLSFGPNKSNGGFVISAEGLGSNMALPVDLSDFNHTDIARHEGVHWKDVLSDGELDGLVAGETKDIQDTMLELMRNFRSGKYETNLIEKIDVSNLNYALGYVDKLDREGEGRKLNPDDPYGNNLTLAYAEARAVLEQEFADKPDEFRAAGKEFSKLADAWDGSTSKYDDSHVKKDGHKDGTAFA